jgi:signal peptidase
MKKYFYGALFGIILAIVMFNVGANTKGAPIITYVYSNSMEPLIKVNDAFIVWPSTPYKVGDIIMFRPVVLDAPYITHRIIGIGDNGFITKGDNSPYKDQDSKEPEVLTDRIVGKVVTRNGQPIILPGIGKFSASLKEGIGNYSKYLSLIFLALGFVTLLTGNKRSAPKRKPRRRYRLRQLYRLTTISAFCFVILSIYFGSRVTQIKYLVSEYPGTQGDQVEVNQPGVLSMEVRNNGFIPVWSIQTGIAPLEVEEASTHIWARSSKEIQVKVSPQYKTGIYLGYVQIYNYPSLLPRSWIVRLHLMNPFLAIMAVGLATWVIFTLCFKMLSHFHGFEGWIPLRAIKDKITDRRLKRARAKIQGRRRGR